MPVKQKKQPTLDVHIRWMIRADWQTVMRIENESFDQTWSE